MHNGKYQCMLHIAPTIISLLSKTHSKNKQKRLSLNET